MKRSATNLWGFPHGVAEDKGPQEAAKEIVKIETGIILSNPFRQVTFEVDPWDLSWTCFRPQPLDQQTECHFPIFFQAEEQPGVTARLYLITGIKTQELAPAKTCVTDAVQASWFPLRQVFDSDPEGAGALVAPFLTGLHRWLDR